MALMVFAASVAAQVSTISYPNGNYIKDMEIQGNYVWCATIGSLVRWNKTDGTYRQYTEKDGLADYYLYCIEKDDRGNLWIGTKKGVQCFDGVAFTTFDKSNSGLADNIVEAVCPAKNGVVWVGTWEGLYRFDGKSWTSYTTQNSGIPDNYIHAVAVDNDGVIWLVHSVHETDKVVSSFDGNTWKTYTAASSGGILSGEIFSLTVDDNNVKWFGTATQLCSFDGKTWNKHEIQYVNDMALDGKGKLWAAAGTLPSGAIYPVYSLSRYDGQSWNALTLDDKLSRPIIAYQKVRIDADGTIWFVTSESPTLGSYSLHSYNGTAVKTYHADGPLSYYFGGIAIDSMNRKWFATDYGVSCFDGKSWSNHLFTLTADDISPSANLKNLNYFINRIEAIVVDRGNVVWVSLSSGNETASFDGKAWKLHSRDEGYINTLGLNDIIVDRNNIKWFVGEGVTSYDGKAWTQYKRLQMQGISGAVDNDNVKWFGTSDQGVWSFDGTAWTNYNKDNSPLKGKKPPASGEYNPLMNWMIRVAADRNNVKWFADLDGVIYSFDGTAWKTFSHEVTGLAGDGYPIVNMYVDRNNILWITQRGLISFDGKAWKTWPGIKTGTDSAIALDADGYMWVASRYSVGEGGMLSASKFSFEPSAVAEPSAFPTALELWSNYPNPFNPSTAISFTLPASGPVSLAVFDITGRKVRDLMNGPMGAGNHSVVWDSQDASGKPVSSGVYLSRLTQGGKAVARRMLLVK
jgi:ligand-binding sensor domain-containing protein